MYKKFDYDNPRGYYAWNTNSAPDAYFIEIDVTEDNYKEIIFYFKNTLHMRLKESYDLAKLHVGKTLKYGFPYMSEWQEKLEEISSAFTRKITFRAYCNDTFVGEKNVLRAGFATVAVG